MGVVEQLHSMSEGRIWVALSVACAISISSDYSKLQWCVLAPQHCVINHIGILSRGLLVWSERLGVIDPVLNLRGLSRTGGSLQQQFSALDIPIVSPAVGTDQNTN